MSGKRNWGDNMFNRRDGKEPPRPFEGGFKVPSKLWKKKYDCKKNKGDHTPVITVIKYCGRGWKQHKDGTWVHEKRNSWWGGTELPYGWVQWECTGCSKHFTEHRIPDKKFDKYRYTIYAR